MAPVKPTQPRVTRAPVGLLPTDPVVEGGDRDRHFHQLLRQLQLREHRALRGGVQRDLRHVNNLLGQRDVKDLQDIHRLVHHLQHKNIERRDRHERLEHGLHGALAGRHPPGSSSYRLKSTGWGGGVVRNLAVYFVSLSSSPALAFLCPREEWC